MKKFDFVLITLAMAATVSCARLFSLSPSEMMAIAAPEVQEAGNTVYLPYIGHTAGCYQEPDGGIVCMPTAIPREEPCRCPIIDGVCRCVPLEQVDQATPEPPACRPPCWVFDGECQCVASVRYSVYLPISTRNICWPCPSMADGTCICG